MIISRNPLVIMIPSIVETLHLRLLRVTRTIAPLTRMEIAAVPPIPPQTATVDMIDTPTPATLLETTTMMIVDDLLWIIAPIPLGLIRIGKIGSRAP